MFNMRGSLATLSSGGGGEGVFTRGTRGRCQMLPGAACDHRGSRGGVRRSQRFSEERQMKADGAKSQSSIPQPSLGDRRSYAGLSQCGLIVSIFVFLANIITLDTGGQRRGPGVSVTVVTGVL